MPTDARTLPGAALDHHGLLRLIESVDPERAVRWTRHFARSALRSKPPESAKLILEVLIQDGEDLPSALAWRRQQLMLLMLLERHADWAATRLGHWSARLARRS